MRPISADSAEKLRSPLAGPKDAPHSGRFAGHPFSRSAAHIGERESPIEDPLGDCLGSLLGTARICMTAKIESHAVPILPDEVMART